MSEPDPTNVQHQDETRSQPGWVSVAEAARALGISETAVRKRIRAGTLATRGERGATQVQIPDANQTRPGAEPSQPGFEADVVRELVETLRAENVFLRAELENRTEEIRRRDHIIAGLVERVKELPATAGAGDVAPDAIPGSVRGAVAAEAAGATAPEKRPWWRRLLFGGSHSGW